jgi:hypothetical protein
MPHSNRLVNGLKILCGTTVQFDCQSGYALVGQRSVTCLDGGRWSTALPHCQSAEQSFAYRLSIRLSVCLLSVRPSVCVCVCVRVLYVYIPLVYN